TCGMKKIFALHLFLAILASAFSQTVSHTLVPYRIGNLWGYSDVRGNIVIPTRYQEAFPFYDEVAAVKSDNHMAIINKDGKLIIPFRYDYISNFNNNIGLTSR